MNRILFDALDNVNEGVVILNEQFKILFWNSYMKHITGIGTKYIIGKSIYEALPNFNKNYFNESIKSLMNNEYKLFFSATMHKDLVNDNGKFNLKISKLEEDKCKFLFLEFISVTNEFERVNQLKLYINKLSLLNKELKDKEKIIKNLAYYDKLTGLGNRVLFYEVADKILDNCCRNNHMLGLMFIDIDNFKSINDTYGHTVGDSVLAEVADILKKATRKNDVIARFGGDEFLVLLPDIKNFNNYKIIHSRIINTKKRIINLGGNKINVSLSTGVSFYPQDGKSIDELIIKADEAMYIAKNVDGNDNCFCSKYIG
ncbi:sensor domain-containing diguanylate cyclase [Clostridium sp. JN-1]|uniref:GGDEF domain-containing protein n=1 Tax=Clostridium sp. JN-1 TaxID=2483110 RepID=UPI000F0B061C|nr:sensor domain-containing diguanylate cyclase [Clostridium sp. JN-1]